MRVPTCTRALLVQDCFGSIWVRQREADHEQDPQPNRIERRHWRRDPAPARPAHTVDDAAHEPCGDGVDQCRVYGPGDEFEGAVTPPSNRCGATDDLVAGVEEDHEPALGRTGGVFVGRQPGTSDVRFVNGGVPDDKEVCVGHGAIVCTGPWRSLGSSHLGGRCVSNNHQADPKLTGRWCVDACLSNTRTQGARGIDQRATPPDSAAASLGARAQRTHWRSQGPGHRTPAACACLDRGDARPAVGKVGAGRCGRAGEWGRAGGGVRGDSHIRLVDA